MYVHTVPAFGDTLGYGQACITAFSVQLMGFVDAGKLVYNSNASTFKVRMDFDKPTLIILLLGTSCMNRQGEEVSGSEDAGTS